MSESNIFLGTQFQFQILKHILEGALVAEARLNHFVLSSNSQPSCESAPSFFLFHEK